MSDRGDTTKLRIQTRGEDGELTDPTALTLTLRSPASEDETFGWPDGAVVRESLGVFSLDNVALTEAGSWEYRWAATGAVALTEAGSLYVNEDDFGATRASAGLYATPQQLRGFLKVEMSVLSDDEALTTLRAACDLIDERVGNWPIVEETGRKIPLDDDQIEAWRLTKLREATLEVAKAIFNDPDIQSRQRARFTGGDISISGVYGPAYGERSAALLAQSGLIRNTARMSGGARRHRRCLR